MDAAGVEVGGHGLGEFCVAQHHGMIGWVPGRRVKPASARPARQYWALSASLWRRSSACSMMSRAARAAPTMAAGERWKRGMGGRVVSEGRSRVVGRDVASQSAAEGLAQRAGEKVDRYARPRRGAAPLRAGEAVAWQSSTMTIAPYLSASARISGSFA